MVHFLPCTQARASRTARRAARCLALAAALSMAPTAMASAPAPLDQRLAEIREINKYVPERALPMLLAIEQEGRAAPLGQRIEFLNQLSSGYDGIGKLAEANAVADELVALGRQHQNNAALAKGYLRKAYMAFRRSELEEAHRLAWEAETLAYTTDDVELKVRARSRRANRSPRRATSRWRSNACRRRWDWRASTVTRRRSSCRSMR